MLVPSLPFWWPLMQLSFSLSCFRSTFWPSLFIALTHFCWSLSSGPGPGVGVGPAVSTVGVPVGPAVGVGPGVTVGVPVGPAVGVGPIGGVGVGVPPDAVGVGVPGGRRPGQSAAGPESDDANQGYPQQNRRWREEQDLPLAI